MTAAMTMVRLMLYPSYLLSLQQTIERPNLPPPIAFESGITNSQGAKRVQTHRKKHCSTFQTSIALLIMLGWGMFFI